MRTSSIPRYLVLMVCIAGWLCAPAVQVQAAPPLQTEAELRAIVEADRGQFFTANDLDELSTALKQAAGGGGELPTWLLVGGAVVACVVPLLLLLLLALILVARRRRRHATVPVGSGYGPPPVAAGRPYASPAYGAPVAGQPYAQQAYSAPPVPTGAGELRLLRGQASPSSLDLSQPLVRLGRKTANHVVVQDPMVSGMHAEIYAQEGRHWIRDLGSKNGIFVNGARLVRPCLLCDGDRIALGGSEWIYRRGGDTMMYSPRAGA